MGFKAKRDENRIGWIFRFPLIRHVRAVIELLYMFFWRNYFNDGEFCDPHKDEVQLIYDIWSGKEKKRRFYIKKNMYRT